MSTGLRLRAAVVAGVVVATAVPVVASALAPHLTCGVKQTGRWERIPVAPFQPINGLAASANDTVTAYSVDEVAPENVLATNGSTVLASRTHGCGWNKAVELTPGITGAQPFLGSSSTIVAVGTTGSAFLAAVQEGAGAASRPHVLRSGNKGAPGSWVPGDNGLPAQGAPRLLRTASDGRTAYLTISPTASGGSDSPTTPGLPGLPGGGTGSPTGFLYRTVDGGASWTLQTGAGDIPGGGTSFTQLDIDPGNAANLYGIVDGNLLVSRDAGASFQQIPGTGYRAVTAVGNQTVLAFGDGGARISYNSGGQFTQIAAPAGVVSVAGRGGQSAVLVQRSSGLSLFEPATGALVPVPPPSAARTGSLLGDRSNQASFHALAGHSLLRYVDPLPKGVVLPPIARGDITTPPPAPGVVSPRAQNLSIPVGETGTADFSLALPKNPTPLDLFFLVDVSNGMGKLVKDYQTKIKNVVRDLTAAKIDLKVGLGIVGTGPTRTGDNEYPETGTYAYAPQPRQDGTVVQRTYTKPEIYKRLRAIGEPGAEFQKALDQLKLETVPDVGTYSNSEGQLIALKNIVNGRGTRNAADLRNPVYSVSGVAPGQNAEWRNRSDVRKIIVLASNEFFQAPFGEAPMGSDEAASSTPENPQLNFAPTIAMLRAQKIGVIGLSAGGDQALPDLRKLALGTGMVAPPGVTCGSDTYEISTGDPLVCNNDDNFSQLITRLLASLTDRQDVTPVPHTRTAVLGALGGASLRQLDVKRPNTVPFTVRVSCIDVKPGTYQQDVDLLLRQSVVGRARVNVTCVKAAAVVKPKPVAIVPNPPPAPQPAPNIPPPPPPPAPAPQPNPQPQVNMQAQVNPMSAAAIQEQQELQLALAMNGTLKDDDPVFSAGAQMAMVDRRRREEVQAYGVLAFAMLTCAGLGLAGLRARPEVRVRRAR